MRDPPHSQTSTEATNSQARAASRRQFLGLVGAGVASTAGYAGTARAQETPVVAMTSNEFEPIGLAVEPGTTVRFELESGSHSATAYEDRIPDGADAFDSGTISAGGFEHTFEESGTYDYYCIPHQSMGMVGRIVVGGPGGPAEERPIPHGEVPDSETILDQGAVTATGSDDGSGGHGGGMMDGEPGMMRGRGMMGSDGSWLMLLMPVGFFTFIASIVGGIAYWASRRGTAAGNENTRRTDDSALTVLDEQYARGEIDDEEYERRRKRLTRDE